MDPVVQLAARALAAGDPLAALKRIALRDDAHALALRGVAMAQLGEWRRARELLRRAARAFGPAAPLSRARCVVAEAEVALASRDLKHDPPELQRASSTLEAGGDGANAALARLTAARRAILLGQIEDAQRMLGQVKLAAAPLHLVATAELVRADVATRALRTGDASAALKRAQVAAERSGIPALRAEVRAASARLQAPVARLRGAGSDRLVRLAEVEQLFRSEALVVDACRRELRWGGRIVRLQERAVLFELLWALAEALPEPATRIELFRRAFAVQRPNDSTRARLRVEIGRLRSLISAFAGIVATSDGFRLQPRQTTAIQVLTPPSEGEADALLALLRGGEPWSTSDLASALGKSQRSVQRALGELEAARRVYSVGKGRARRWLTPPVSPLAPFAQYATAMLLVAAPRPS